MRESERRTRFINVLKYEALSVSLRCSFEERGDSDAFTLKNEGSSLVLHWCFGSSKNNFLIFGFLIVGYFKN